MSMSLGRSAMPFSSSRAPSLTMPNRQRSRISSSVIGGADAQARRSFDDRRLPVRGRAAASAAAGLVAVPALAALLAQAAHLGQLQDQVVPAPARVARGHLRLARGVAHVVAGHVVHREDAHGVAEARQRGIHLVRQRAVFHQEVRLAVVLAEQRVADEAGIDPRQHGHLADARAQGHQRGDHVVGGVSVRTTSSSRITWRG
jgi:hypothetical protein